jgi:hypothetical protein
MTAPSRIGDLSADVLRHAALREGLPRKQRLHLGGATLLAFLQQAHGDDAADILRSALAIAGDRSHDSAETALNALAEVGAILDVAPWATCEFPRAALRAIGDALEQASAALRPTLPPHEERVSTDNPIGLGLTCPGYLAHGSSKVPCERCGLLFEDHP